MHFGIFLEERRPGESDLAALQETVRLTDAAEAWGLDGVWLGEINFNPVRSVSSSPIAIASFLAARTRRVRIGLAVQVIPLAHPLRIAQDVATVDQLSEGRFDFGIGRSGSPRAYDILGIPYAESQGRFEEALDVILKAWTGERFSHHGRYFSFDNALVGPRPYQRPHPPLRMAANSKETFPVVARLGLPLFVGLRDHDLRELQLHVAAYREAWRQAGHPGEGDVCLRIPIYAAPTEQAAREEPRENFTYFFQRHAELLRSGMGRADTGPADRRRTKFEQVKGLTYDEILETRVAVGTAAGLADRLREIGQLLGLTGIVAELNPGGLLPLERMERTLGIFTREVIPSLR
jgi:alkanesulfonate monooxygenase SsuD/methylene tetrahydromethanopterin reductase-like flavin-dependent oxidoreductase (luciferase family)